MHIENLEKKMGHKRGSGKTTQIIATLGPKGTCSENTVKYYIRKKRIAAEITLKNSFHECIEDLKGKRCDMVIIPSAFKDLNEIIFRNLGKIKISESFIFDTPAMVVAANNCLTEVRVVATHPAPAPLAQVLFPDAKIIFSASNSVSAIMTQGGRADACITTETAAKIYGLKIIKNFGKVPMSWNVFVRAH